MEERNLLLPDVRLRYRCTVRNAASDQPTLIFLHYFGGSSRTWSSVIALIPEEFSCVSIDLRGSGDSHVGPDTAGTSLAYSLDSLAGDLPALIGELGCRRYVLVGHSMGGKVALAAATAHGCPPGLQSLVLLAPSPPTPEPMSSAERTRLLAGYGEEAAARQTLEEITARPLSPGDFAEALADQLRVAPAMWRAWLEYGNRQDISMRLPRLQVPVFLATGANDPNITPGLLRRSITDKLPSTLAREPELVPDAAHLLPLDAPTTVARFIQCAANTL